MMQKLIKKKVLVPILAITFLVVGSGFKSDFFEIAKQIEIFLAEIQTIFSAF